MSEVVYKLHDLPEVVDCEDYNHYCATRYSAGLQVIPESLFGVFRTQDFSGEQLLGENDNA